MRERGTVAPFVALAVALVVGALVVVFARSDSGPERQARSRLVGQPAPLLDGETVEGGTYNLAARRGRWIVVNFMASWCTPCRQEQPELASFANRHAASGDAEVVAVVVNDTATDVADFFATFGEAGPAVLDPEGAAYVAFGIVKVPETYLVDPDGIVVAKVNGRVSADGLDALVSTFSRARAGASG